VVQFFRDFTHKYFSDEEAVILALLLIAATLGVIYFGAMLAPFLAALIVAFILQGIVAVLTQRGIPEWLAISAVFVLFLGILTAFLLGLMPLIWSQVMALAAEMPRIFTKSREYLDYLPEAYPSFVSQQSINNLYQEVASEAAALTQWLVSFSISSIPQLMAVLIYMVLLPILVFFFLKDRRVLLAGVSRLLPSRRPLMDRIWREVMQQCANYVRGKALEIFVVGTATYICFKVMGVPYSALLALLVGISVLIPYIGAAVVTIPVAMIALFEFGWSSDFIWVMVVYGIIQALDGNVLVPILFSEVNNLHPVVIILAVLFFGGVWGFWGVFFAIPLATVLKAVFNAWPVKVVPVAPRPLDEETGV